MALVAPPGLPFTANHAADVLALPPSACRSFGPPRRAIRARAETGLALEAGRAADTALGARAALASQARPSAAAGLGSLLPPRTLARGSGLHTGLHLALEPRSIGRLGATVVALARTIGCTGAIVAEARARPLELLAAPVFARARARAPGGSGGLATIERPSVGATTLLALGTTAPRRPAFGPRGPLAALLPGSTRRSG